MAATAATGWLSVQLNPKQGPGILAVGSAIAGFILAYVNCYIIHEWGHLFGARVTGGHMPLLPYRNVLIGSFDLNTHNRRQFLALSWGGVLGYLFVFALCLVIWRSAVFGWFGAGLALGAAAFVVQSLAVDLPQIWRVTRGADIVQTSATGATSEVILRRTWQTWLPLAAAVIGYNYLL